MDSDASTLVRLSLFCVSGARLSTCGIRKVSEGMPGTWVALRLASLGAAFTPTARGNPSPAPPGSTGHNSKKDLLRREGP